MVVAFRYIMLLHTRDSVMEPQSRPPIVLHRVGRTPSGFTVLAKTTLLVGRRQCFDRWLDALSSRRRNMVSCGGALEVDDVASHDAVPRVAASVIILAKSRTFSALCR